MTITQILKAITKATADGNVRALLDLMQTIDCLLMAEDEKQAFFAMIETNIELIEA